MGNSKATFRQCKARETAQVGSHLNIMPLTLGIFQISLKLLQEDRAFVGVLKAFYLSLHL